MACEIERPSPQALFDRYKKLFSATVLGGAEIIPESNEWYATSVNYAIAEEFYAISSQAWKERDPRQACCDNLIDMASVDGVYPLPAQPAQGYVELTGTPETPLPSPLEFTIGELTFVTASGQTQPNAIGVDGKATIRVRAITPGAAGNIAAGTGTLQNTLDGVERTVKVCGGTFCQGTDAETCEAFRARYLRRLQYNPRATNAWIMDKLTEWPCATRSLQRAGLCCECINEGETSVEGPDCGCADCGGALEFYLMFDNTFDCGIAPTDVITEVQDWLFGSPQGYGLGQVEVGVCGRVVPVKGFQVDVNVDVADCITTAQVAKIETLISEYFTTLTPSQPLRGATLQSLLTNVLGVSVNASAMVELVDNSVGYGGNGLPFVEGVSAVFIGNCDLEPECDYMPCLRNVSVNRSSTIGVSCS